MKRFLLSAAAIAAFTGCAFAADLPSRKAPIVAPPPPPMWTGFYGGLNVGYGWATSSNVRTNSFSIYDWASGELDMPYGFTSPYTAGNSNMNANGFMGGAQVGYNYQFSNNFLAGLEADIQGSAIRGTGQFAGFGGATDVNGLTHLQYGNVQVNQGLNWLGTVRGRLGYVITPTFVAYATGGLAYGDAWANASTSGFHWHPNALEHGGAGGAPCVVGQGCAPENPVLSTWGNASQILVGYTVGGGFEWMFMQNVSLKAEALYYDLGSQTITTNPSGVVNNRAPSGDIAILNQTQTTIRQNGVTAKVGANYHFNWGAAPVVASY